MKKKHQNSQDAATAMLNACFYCNTPESLAVMEAFAAYLGQYRITAKTAPVFLRVIGTNQPSVISALLNGRHPFVIFRHIKPDKELIVSCISILTQLDPINITKPALFALLGLLDMAYKNPQSAPLRIGEFELNHIAKYLDESKDQLEEDNKIILRLLEYFYIGERTIINDPRKHSVGIHAMKLRLAFFDSMRGLRSIIPEQLLSSDIQMEMSIQKDETPFFHTIDNSVIDYTINNR